MEKIEIIDTETDARIVIEEIGDTIHLNMFENLRIFIDGEEVKPTREC